jgi:hypothetical protein
MPPTHTCSRPECEACRASGQAAQLPKPFTSFPEEADRIRHSLELLVLLDHVTDNSCHSLGDICESLEKFLKAQSVELGRTIRCPRYNTIRVGLPTKLARLLFLSFERPVDLFRMEGHRFTGLTDDARTAVRLALDYFEATSRCEARS